MNAFAYRYLKLADICEFNNLNYADIIDAISMSDVSFGTNYDTLITSDQLEDILEDFEILVDNIDYDSHNDSDDVLLISLGS